MPSFVVDPLLVTMPALEQEPRELEQWLLGLKAWLGEQSASPFLWKHMQECSRRLEEFGRYPSFDALKQAVRIAGVDVNVSLLVRELSLFFQREEHALGGMLATKSALADPDPTLEPAAIPERNLEGLRQDLADELLCLACDRAAQEPFASKAHFVTAAIESGETSGPVNDLRVHGKVEMTEPESVIGRLSGVSVDEKFPLIFSPRDLGQFIRYDDFSDATRDGKDGPDGQNNRFFAFISHLANAKHPGDRLLSCRLGTEFLESLKASAIESDTSAREKLMRVLAAVATRNDKDANFDLRHVRQNEAGDSSQRCRARDNAGAWRLTISSGGAGWRLHYWAIPARAGQDEAIEFSLVLRKQDDAGRMADDP